MNEIAEENNLVTARVISARDFFVLLVAYSCIFRGGASQRHRRNRLYSSPARSLLLTISCSLMMTLFVGCAGYHVGNQYLFRSDIRSVHVPVFESDSFRRFLGVQLTEVVIKEIEASTPLVIGTPQLADSFLRGRILSEEKSVVGENRSSEPRALDVNWRVEVTWTDRAGVPLMQRQILRIDRNAILIPEGGQSLATAHQSIIERLARDIVGQMERPAF